MAEVTFPSGIVSFLFSDIEGSTRLFHNLGARYTDVLDLHNRVLRSVWSAHRGAEVSTEGDSFLVAFGTADDAITAAAAGQRALAAVEWPEDVNVKVRMGIHSGLAAPRGNSYVSMAVHQASRVIGTGHGGQVVVTQDTEFLATPALETALRPLGRFRLRDFPQPVRLYQVVGEGLEDHFPAIRATPADRHNILEKPTLTIGREATVAAIAEQVAARRVVTLIGPGGVGKSRIATDLGLAIAPAWEDGVWLVELAGVAEPDLVAGAVAEAVGAPTRPGGARTDDVLEHLETHRAVVVLDNCEHLAGACRELIVRMQTNCEHVGVIATSREPLWAPGEIRWPVEPLPVPVAPVSAAGVLDSPAGRLFRERGAAVRPGFDVDERNAAVVAEIVSHLDGLPLLIELAAAHLSSLSPREILDGLEDSFRFLRSRDPQLSDRHRTIEGLLTWSYRLLESREQAALRSLSVFASDFSREASLASIADGVIDIDEVDELVWSLVDRSLVETDFETDETRYRLLETVRSYGRRHLDQAGETNRVAIRLAEWFLERLGPWLPPDRSWVGEVRIELDNLRTLISLIPDQDQELAQNIACSIGRYHDAAQSFHEGIKELTRLVTSLERPSATRVSLLTILGGLHLRTGNVDEAQRLVDSAEGMRGEHGAPEWDDVAVERTRGEIARRVGDLAGAVEIARETLEQPLSDRGRSRMNNLLGTTSAALGDFDTAYDACLRELEINERLGYEGYVASAHGNLAEVALRLGDFSAAARHQRLSLELAMAQGTPALVAFALIVAARIAGWQETWTTAVAIHAKAEERLEEIGLVLYEDDLRQSEALLESAKRQLGDADFEGARSKGLAMTISAAVDLAYEIFSSAQRAPS